MAYIGKAPNTAIVNQTTSQSFNGTGSATAFTLNRSVNVSEDLEVFVNNVQQEPGSGKAYTASGTTLTFSAAPASGTGNIYVIYRGEATINPRLEHDANAALAATTGTFSGAVSGTTGTFSGAFTSPGIDDNADANAITIDSSEKVGIGDTSPLGNKVHIRTAGSATSVNGDAGLVLESDDSTRCDLQFMGPDGAYQSIYFGDVSDDNRGIIAYSHSGNNMRFTVDASERMRLTADGLTFNGDTAASNALDDYEEGNFTATVASGISVSSYDHQIGHYVKVGRMVTAWVFMEYNGSSRTSSHFIISGLPFTSSNDTSNEATMGGFITYQNNFSSAHNIIHVARNNTKAFFYELDGSDLIGSELSGASGEVRFVVQYTVA